MLIGNAIGIGFGRKRKLIISDSFNRTDSALTMGNANTGQAWSALAGTWGISSNQAYLVSATAQAIVVDDAGNPNITLTADLTLSPTLNTAGAGFVVRVIDNNNYILIDVTKTGTGVNDLISIYKRDVGTFTQLATLSSAGNVNGTMYKYRVTPIGNNINVYRDGILKLSYTLIGADATKFGTPTKCGIRVNFGGDDGLSRFDNYMVEAI